MPVISDNFLELLNLKMSSAADFPTKKPGKPNSGTSDLPILKPSSGRFVIFSLSISLFIVLCKSASFICFPPGLAAVLVAFL